MAWYDIVFTRKDADDNVVIESAFCLNLDPVLVTKASQGNGFWQSTLAKRIYVQWKTKKPEGRRKDDGNEFLYQELEITDRPKPQDVQPSLFDDES